jgi:peptidoglycan hydrolase-like protein with peptidoglycan-binding domain
MIGEKTKNILFDSGCDEKKEPLLNKGSKEKEAIITLQNLLNKKGYNCGNVDGFFGDNTYKAVISFQKDYKLSIDGIVGITTWAALKSEGESVSCFTNENNKDNEIKKIIKILKKNAQIKSVKNWFILLNKWKDLLLLYIKMLLV